MIVKDVLESSAYYLVFNRIFKLDNENVKIEQYGADKVEIEQFGTHMSRATQKEPLA